MSIGLSREVSQAEKSVVTTNCEKSAEVIVPKKKKFFREGLNNSKRQFEMYVSNINLTRCEIEAYLKGSITNIW